MSEVILKKSKPLDRIMLNLSRDEYWVLLGLLSESKEAANSPCIENVYKKLRVIKCQ